MGARIDLNNSTSKEIERRIQAANKCYYGLTKHFKSRLITKNTKVMLYKTLLRPVLTYGSESWVVNKTDERRLAVFERKILRRIYGPVEENGTWRRRHNRELYTELRDAPVMDLVNLNRLRWAGHLRRMEQHRIPFRVLSCLPVGKRKVGRPKSRWVDQIGKTARHLGVEDWWNVALERNQWAVFLREAKARAGL